MKYYNYPNGTKMAEALDSENTSVVKGPDGKYIAPNELPAITAQDAGKVVKVNAAGTGLEYGEAGGGAFIFTFTPGDNSTYTTNKTAKEIFDASCVGPAIAIYSVGSMTASLSVGTVMATPGGYGMSLISTDGMMSFGAASDDATLWISTDSN